MENLYSRSVTPSVNCSARESQLSPSDIPVSLAHTDKVDTHDSSCAQSTPLDRGLIQRPKVGNVWVRFVDARGRSSRTTVMHFSLAS